MSDAARVCVLAEMTYPAAVKAHTQDLDVYVRLRPVVSRFYLVVTSRGDRAHVSHAANVLGIHIPYHRNAVLRKLRYAAAVLGLRRHLARKRIDLYMAAEPLTGGLIGLLLSRLASRPLLVHVQGDLLTLPSGTVAAWRTALIRRVAIAVTRRATRVRCISAAVYRACRDAGVPDARLTVLPVRCDFSWFDADRWRGERQAMRAAWNVDERAQVILCTGGLNQHKGQAVLLQAFAALRARHPGARLVLIGEGDRRAALEREAETLGIGSDIVMPGWVAYDRVPAALAAADIYVQPSFNEGIPRATLEAMAMRVPVIASRVGGLPELLDDGTLGALVPPGQPAALAGAIEALLADPRRGAELAARARDAARARYSFESNVRAYGELIRQTIAEGAGRSA